MGSVIESKLVAHGASHVKPGRFVGTVRGQFRLVFHGWTVWDLMARPRKAVLFCDLIRTQLRAESLPDEFILEALQRVLAEDARSNERPTKLEMPSQ